MASRSAQVRIKRVYDTPAPEDGTRVLVDRLWPRGLTRERARVDHWLKDVSPSAELRVWYGHAPERAAEFRRRYKEELEREPGRSAFAALRELMREGPITFVYAAKDTERNNAAALREMVTGEGQMG